jgi:isoaspartyl peptidase/L-asparaginase-like protein (Ntn-hydrolase superfamily)
VAAPAVAVHGGAGHGPAGGEDAAAPHRRALADAVEVARGLLRGGAPALEAAVAAVAALEDCPLFNAGSGAVATEEGAFELDAAAMDGASGRAGAVAAVVGVRNPVRLARVVMESTPHVLLAGEGARRLAERSGLELAGPEWFARRSEGHDPGDARPAEPASPAQGGGTVGAVVLDGSGRLAAATSTGGVRGQLPGRVGDTPVPGAGTYADDLVAVSGTGRGEALMQTVAAHELAALVRHAGLGLAEAGERVAAALGPLGGGGLIAVGRDGAIAMPFTTPAMYRGWASGDEPVATAVGPAA